VIRYEQSGPLSGLVFPANRLGGEEFVVKRKRFSVEQIVAALKQVELGMPVADLTRRLGISEVTYYRWKKKYPGMQSDQV
jgi:transposase-like protein